MTTIVLSAAMLLACVPVSASVLTLDDGATHNLDYAVAQDDVHVRNSTTANLLTGGSIDWYLQSFDTSTVNISGGTLVDFLEAYDTSEVNVSGGTMGDNLYAFDDSTVTVSGGSIEKDLYAFNDSTLTIIGTGFNFAYGDYGTGNWTNGTTLTGTLEDGTAFNNDVTIFSSGTVTLAAPATAVPEPSSIAMFGIGALGLFGYGRRRRQTSAAA